MKNINSGNFYVATYEKPSYATEIITKIQEEFTQYFAKNEDKFGEIKNFNFKTKSHYELGYDLKMLDFELATKTSGARFVFVKDKLAMLERAISNFMLDTHIKENGYTEIYQNMALDWSLTSSPKVTA